MPIGSSPRGPSRGSAIARTRTAAGATPTRASRTSPPRCWSRPRCTWPGPPSNMPSCSRRAGPTSRPKGGIAGLRRRYGSDKTFAVPILTNCALAGLVPWRDVPPLPFELACLPYGVLRFLRLPVVSYAIPALVAIGQARFFHRWPRNPLTWLVRRLAVGRSLKTLERMQPASGGFLEAVPLTSFVVMSLASTGRGQHPVARRGVAFLLDTVAARRLLAHRHEPRHVEHHAGDQRLGGSGGQRRRAGLPGLAAGLSASERPSLHPGVAGRLGMERRERGRARRRRHGRRPAGADGAPELRRRGRIASGSRRRRPRRGLAARSAERRRRLADVLPRLGHVAVRPQRRRSDGARPARPAARGSTGSSIGRSTRPFSAGSLIWPPSSDRTGVGCRSGSATSTMPTRTTRSMARLACFWPTAILG